MKNNFKNKIKLVLGTLVVCFLMCELGVRTHDALKGYNFFSNEHRDQTLIKSSVVPFRTFGPNFYTEKDNIKYIRSVHGELYTLEKPDNTFRIVCFGGYVSVKEKAAHHKVFNNIIREVAKTTNSYFVDNDSLWQENPNTSLMQYIIPKRELKNWQATFANI